MAIYRSATGFAASSVGYNGEYRPRAEVGQSFDLIAVILERSDIASHGLVDCLVSVGCIRTVAVLEVRSVRTSCKPVVEGDVGSLAQLGRELALTSQSDQLAGCRVWDHEPVA